VWPPDRGAGTQRVIPGVLWISLSALGLFSGLQFVIGLAQMNVGLLIMVVVNVLLLVGLYHGRRRAFVATLVLGLLVIVVMLARSPGVGLGVLVGNGLVLVPLVLAREYFWPTAAAVSTNRANYCHRCGQDLQDVAQPRCPTCGARVRAGGGADLP
jgi:hypothetical protein